MKTKSGINVSVDAFVDKSMLECDNNDSDIYDKEQILKINRSKSNGEVGRIVTGYDFG